MRLSSAWLPAGLLLPFLAVTVVADPYSGGCPMGYAAQQRRRHAEPELDLELPSHHVLLRRQSTNITQPTCQSSRNVDGGGTSNTDWWPCQLRLDVLRQFSGDSNPLGREFNYKAAFQTLDWNALKGDIRAVMNNSQPWWPADFGTYGGLFIRMAWHAAGTYRAIDGRGGAGMGQQRFAPLNSWPDNQNLDRARRLLWPVKRKYGNAISWADLIPLAGNVALESFGFPVLGFGAGRPDVFESDKSIYWGSETQFFPNGNDKRYNGSTDISGRSRNLEAPLSATNMGLIYVDPRGPSGRPDPVASGQDIRVTFGRMGMNDSETVALIAGGHAFGKTHGAGSGDTYCGPGPEGADIGLQGLGWNCTFGGTGHSDHAITSGLEVIWSTSPTRWSNHYLNNLLRNEQRWTLTTSPGGAPQWHVPNGSLIYPNPFNNTNRTATMLTSDLALIKDPVYRNISMGYMNDFRALTNDFAHAWFKLLHRDMGPKSRYLGPEVPKEDLIWQDPLPASDNNNKALSQPDIANLKQRILATDGLNISNLASVAWASASTFRFSDKKGGANGARLALEPMRNWQVNNPAQVSLVLGRLRTVQQAINVPVSMADMIVLGGCAAVEQAAKNAGFANTTVPFTPGRVDAVQQMTDISQMEYLNPQGDGFRNWRNSSGYVRGRTEEILVDKAALLTLTPPEMTVLVGGMRALRTNWDRSPHGYFTNRPLADIANLSLELKPEFFQQLLSMDTVWTPNDGSMEIWTGRPRANTTSHPDWTATRADLVFGSHPELRATAEVYASRGNEQKFVDDFVRAWDKVMMLDRYDVR